MFSTSLNEDLVRQADCVIIFTAHRDLPYSMIAGSASLIVDTRNALASFGLHTGERHIVRL